MHSVVVKDLVLLMELSELGSLLQLLNTSPALVLKSEAAQFLLLISLSIADELALNLRPL